jgi:hypothetical protein
LLVDIGAAYLIARLIHAETLPGDKQFWLTRPYSRGSLLIAKLLGLLLLVNAPIFGARLYVLLADGFPMETIIAPLLWSQLLLFVGAMLPIAALASVTSGMVPFTFSTLALVAVALGTNASMRPPSAPAIRLNLNGTQWLWDSIAVLTLIAFAIPVLYIQYRLRRTWASRLVIVLVGIAGVAAYLYVPWTTAAAIQTAISAQRFDPKAIKVTLAPEAKHFYSRGMIGRQGFQLDVPLKIGGIPQDVELIPDAVSLTFEAADGVTWSSGAYIYPALGKDRPGPGPTILNANVDLPMQSFERIKNQPVKLTAELYVTLFGNPQRKTIPIQATPVGALAGLQCRSGAFRQLVCSAPFGWPARLIYAQFPSGGMLAFTRFISYSPFPAGLAFDAGASRAVTVPEGEREVTIVTTEPLASLRHVFAIENFPLAELSLPITGTTRRE